MHHSLKWEILLMIFFWTEQSVCNAVDVNAVSWYKIYRWSSQEEVQSMIHFKAFMTRINPLIVSQPVSLLYFFFFAVKFLRSKQFSSVFKNTRSFFFYPVAITKIILQFEMYFVLFSFPYKTKNHNIICSCLWNYSLKKRKNVNRI